MFVIFMVCVNPVCVCVCGMAVYVYVFVCVCGGEAVVLCCGITDRNKPTTPAQRVRCVVFRLSCMVV
jgi:hypothetical protein